ncbi:MAG: IPT/TIG domain-containing protein, partial [Litorilinea sp.]
RRSGLGITFVHEIGHNYNRRHIDCGNPKRPDTNYTYDTMTLDDRALDVSSTHFGFDTRLVEPLAPDASRDYMSYCGPRWVSDYTWKAIVNNTRDAGPLFPLSGSAGTAESRATAQADAYVLASGMLTPTLASGELISIWTYPTADAGAELIQKWEADVAVPWTDEPYHVRVLGAEGEILSDRVVELIEIEEQDEPEVYSFHVIFPAPAEPAQTIQLLSGETVLHSHQTGAATPAITILAPTGGANVDATFTLEWTATDADDPPWLLYSVQYSPDLGETWYSLVVDLPGPGQGQPESLLLDLRGQPGTAGATALLRVLASDGYNTGIATSAPFSVAPRAPDVQITAPEAGQWFAAGTPIPLRGDAFDAEDGILNDNAFVWRLSGMEIPSRTAVALGLPPGTFTATLEATDSDAQQGSAQVPFYVAPLNVPRASGLALDGKCSDVGYATLSLPLAPYTTGDAAGDAATATLARTDDHLWVCLQGLQGTGESAGIHLDVDNSQESTIQTGDLGFFVELDGTLIVLNGTAPTPIPSGVEAHISGDATAWRAELRIHADLLGGWNRQVALQLGHYLADANAAWPHTADPENPQSWAQTNLGAGPTLTLTALDPISATVGVSTTLTISGTGFDANTVVLWEGSVLTPTLVDAGTLLVTVEADQLDHAGLHQVEVAPGAALALTSTPHAFLVSHAAAAISELTPNTAPVASAGFTLVVEGSGFAEGAAVLWNGEARPTTFVNASRLEAQISAADVAAALPVPVTVANPDPNAGSAGVALFTIQPPEIDDDPFKTFLPSIERD